LWDVEGGLGELDKYMYMSDDNIRAGALLGMGMSVHYHTILSVVLMDAKV